MLAGKFLLSLCLACSAGTAAAASYACLGTVFMDRVTLTGTPISVEITPAMIAMVSWQDRRMVTGELTVSGGAYHYSETMPGADDERLTTVRAFRLNAASGRVYIIDNSAGNVLITGTCQAGPAGDGNG